MLHTFGPKMFSQTLLIAIGNLNHTSQERSVKSICHIEIQEGESGL